MRFIEIANPEEKLALWKLVSDNMWAAFGQQAQLKPNPKTTQQLAKSPYKAANQPISRNPAKPLDKRKTTIVKAHKPKKAPIAPAPKPLPKPKPFQVTPTQASKQQTQQHQQLAHHIHQALMQKPLAPKFPQSTQPQGSTISHVEPLQNSYSERDKDELVLHRRENPFIAIGDQKMLY